MIPKKFKHNNVIAWGAALLWVGLSSYYIYSAKMKLTVKDLLLMMPQCCEMTDLVGNGYVVFSPDTMIKLCFGFVLLHFVTWWMTAEDMIDKRDVEVAKLVNLVEKQLFQDEETEEVLLNNSKSLVDNIEVEFEHCAALIGTNNETPGRRVGGEVEWATGETTSEDEDATREVVGARIKTQSQIEDEKILRCLTFPNENLCEKMYKYSGQEPNLKSSSSLEKFNQS